MTQKILITGAAGFLGSTLARLLASAPNIDLYTTVHHTPCSHGHNIPLDLTRIADCRDTLQTLAPDIVIHTAYSKVPAEMPAVIVQGTRDLAGTLGHNSRFIHISTDYIFDGFHGPYVEHDLPQPHTPYGQAKYAAELAVQEHCTNYAIIRTSLISGTSPLPPRWIAEYKNLKNRQPLTFFTNEIRNPIHVDDLATAIIEVAHSDFQGPLHIAGPQYLSRFDELSRFVTWQKLDPNLISPAISNGKTRPLNCSLATKHFQNLFTTPLRSVDEFWPGT